MKNRRALSTVVGTVFSIIALATTIGYVTYSMTTLSNFNQATLAKNQENQDTSSEKLQVVSATIVNNKFNITVQNTGNIPINITRLWVQDPTTTTKYDLKTAVYPGQTTKNIGQALNLTPDISKSYDMMFVTQRGNNVKFLINSASQAPLYIKTFTFPPTVSTEFDTAVFMMVTNNGTSMILNLQPAIDTPNTNGCLSCSWTYRSGPDPPSIPSLKPGETASFKWVYTIAGAAADKVTFTTRLANGISSNTASASTEVRDVVTSLQAGTALKSIGVSSQGISNSMLFMHQETLNVPSSRYQLMPPLGDASGTTIAFDANPLKFFTKNGTDPITIPSGTWNASLRYSSAVVPTNVNALFNHTFHFNANPDGTNLPSDYPLDSSSYSTCWGAQSASSSKPTGTARPTWGATYGVNGSGAYYFDGSQSQYFAVQAQLNCNQQDAQPDTTAGWFKADVKPTYHTKQAIWSIGTGSEFWEIAIGDGTSGNHGKLFFRFNAGSGGTVTCSYVKSGSDGYMDGQWHHFAAVRDNDQNCKLYVDETLQNSSTGTTQSGSNKNIAPTGDLFIGRTPGGGSPFYGYLDSLMNWKDAALSSSEVTNLKNGNFGTAAHNAKFVLDKTDKNGNFVANIFTTNSYDLPFMDKRHWSSSTSVDVDRDNYWAGANFTKTNVPLITLSNGERLNFSMSFVSGSKIDIRLDDKLLAGSGDPWSSFIQMPPSDPTFPSYIQYDRATQTLQIVIFNEGPYGSWLTSQGTRAVFNDTSSTRSYAAVVRGVNGTDVDHKIDEQRDSVFLPVGSTNTLYFYDPQTRPDRNSDANTILPAGTYYLNVFINGYDERGETFLRKTSFGIITVT